MAARSRRRSNRHPTGNERSQSQRADAAGQLVDDHAKIKQLLAELKRASADEQSDLLSRLQSELETHTRLEEEVFYPAFREAACEAADRQLYHDARAEHEAVEAMLARLQEANISLEEFRARVHVLRVVINHHVREEEGRIFPMACDLMNSGELEELSERMQQRRDQLQQGWMETISAKLLGS